MNSLAHGFIYILTMEYYRDKILLKNERFTEVIIDLGLQKYYHFLNRTWQKGAAWRTGLVDAEVFKEK